MAQADRRALCVLVAVFAVMYSYCFQGGGWNQNSHFDTIRAIVEQGSPAITSLASNTGDVGMFKGRIYANKPPGLAYVGTPAYFVLYHVEAILGIKADAFPAVNVNAHILTFVTSAVPALAMLVALYLAWRREGASPRECSTLTAMFGMGSLAFPYSGVMVNQPLSGALLFGAWYLITSPARSGWSLGAAGLLAGWAMTSDFVAPPIGALYLIYLLVAVRSIRWTVAFSTGMAMTASVLLLHNYVNFESALVTNSTIQAKGFEEQGLLFGMLGWPDPRRILWLTVHPFRGLFYCCPVLLVALLSWHGGGVGRVPGARGLAVSVVSYFAVFNLSFNGWTGGWGVGPRYLIPALPFLFFFALGGFRRYPTMSVALTVVSVIAMVAVSVVGVMQPGPNSGEPPAESPVLYCLGRLLAGEVSTSEQGMLEKRPMVAGEDQWDSYNLGEVLGLKGAWSVAPMGLLLAFLAVWIGRLSDAREEGRHYGVDVVRM